MTPCRVQTPFGPSKLGPARGRRTPVFVQQPVGSHAVTRVGGAFGGADVLGALPAGVDGRPRDRSGIGATTTGSSASRRDDGGRPSTALPRQACAAARRRATSSGLLERRKVGSDADCPRRAAASATSLACSRSRARTQVGDCSASTAWAEAAPAVSASAATDRPLCRELLIHMGGSSVRCDFSARTARLPRAARCRSSTRVEGTNFLRPRLVGHHPGLRPRRLKPATASRVRQG